MILTSAGRSVLSALLPLCPKHDVNEIKPNTTVNARINFFIMNVYGGYEYL